MSGPHPAGAPFFDAANGAGPCTGGLEERGQVVQALFAFFQRDGLSYCVLGDARDYPSAIQSDVDIAVRHESLDGVPETIARFCRERSMRLVQLIRHERTAAYFVLAWRNRSGRPDFVAVDVCSDYLRHGRLLLTADELLNDSRLAPGADGSVGFHVPAAATAFIYYLIKKVEKQTLDDRHGEYLSLQWDGDPDGAARQVRRFWTRAEDAELIIAAAAGNEWSAVRRTLPRLKRALRRTARLTVAGAFGELRRHAARMLRPTGLTVAFIGPDGCGKSTVIERILADLAPAFRGTVRKHLRPCLLGHRSGAADNREPHALPSRGVILSAAKLLYFLFDYAAGYALKVRPLTVRSHLVIFDRYYHDLLVDPRRFRYGAPVALARWVARLVPEPDLCVLLDAPPEVLQARKREVTAEESERQRLQYLEVASRFSEEAIVDAAQPLEEVVAEVESAVLGFLERRLEDRYPELRAHQNPLSARLLHYFCRHDVPVLSKLFRIAFNSDIYCRMRSPILMPHPYGIIIHSRSVIGSRVTVMQQVTIGSKDPGESVAPVIEDDVYIGAGAKVLGGVSVGEGAVIGANAVVTRDVPPFCTVVGFNRIVRDRRQGNPAALARPARPRPVRARLIA